MSDNNPAFLSMRQSLIDRGFLDGDFRLTAAGNEYAAAIIIAYGRRTPKPSRKAKAVKSMGAPDYKYQPRSGESRSKQSDSVRKRLGIPEGHRRVYGVHVPEAIAEAIRPVATEIAAKKGFDAAQAFVAEAEANGWKYDAAKVRPKSGDPWTEERRKKASEGAAAAHARRRARIAEVAKLEAVQQVEEVVNVQTKVQSATVCDDGIRQVHGALGVDSENKPRRLTIIESDKTWIQIDVGYGAIWLRAAQARYVGEQLIGLAARLDRREGIVR